MSEKPKVFAGYRWGLYAALSLIGGVGLTLCDRVHLHYRILKHTGHPLFDQAGWVLPSFVLMSAVALLGFRALHQPLGRLKEPCSWKRCLWSMAAFFAVYASTGPFGDLRWQLAVALTAFWMLRLALKPDRAALIYSLILGLLGPLAEAANSAAGNFYYLDPDLGSVPSWLPAIYLHGGLMVSQLDAALDRS